MTNRKLYTARELAEVLHLHPQTIYRLANRGEIQAVKVGWSRRFLMPDMKGQNNESAGIRNDAQGRAEGTN